MTFVTAEDFAPTVTASPLSPEQRTAAIAAAEAECRAAIAAVPPDHNGQLELSADPRCMRAIEALMDIVTLDEDDQRNFNAYLRYGGEGMYRRKLRLPEQLIKTMKRWPRIRKYWPRIRRRICWGCGKEYDLSEPRLWVCGGCDEARYCDEACQRAHWREHEGPCLEKFAAKGRERRAQGESMEKIRQEYNEWYPASQLWGNP